MVVMASSPLPFVHMVTAMAVAVAMTALARGGQAALSVFQQKQKDLKKAQDKPERELVRPLAHNRHMKRDTALKVCTIPALYARTLIDS
jgi:hypothetical protein